VVASDDLAERLIHALGQVAEVTDAVAPGEAMRLLDDVAKEAFWRDWPNISSWRSLYGGDWMRTLTVLLDHLKTLASTKLAKAADGEWSDAALTLLLAPSVAGRSGIARELARS